MPLCLTFPYYSSTFDDNAQWLGYLLLKTAIMEFTNLSFICFIQASNLSAADVSQLTCLWTLPKHGCLCANERVFVLLPCKMRANIQKRGLFCFTSDCAVVLVAALLEFARAGETAFTMLDYPGWFLYSLTEAKIISVSEWKATSSRSGFSGDALSRVVHEKVVPQCAEKFRDAGMCREIAVAL